MIVRIFILIIFNTVHIVKLLEKYKTEGNNVFMDAIHFHVRSEGEIVKKMPYGISTPPGGGFSFSLFYDIISV